ncbi:outer membrane beta-barrel protein [Vibrio pectenicida]|uniref:Outer membrane protein beta-barrel domain-containing protein n=1 Tax=Vibrio pectenicida TaxID=62763 RepID=A0A3R9F666_9VIBR|nr:outer membrane beta-barrel protein [Vibrio pectenicida]RSD30774.1 hypothetical protein EJA03_12220 [Vibrio pectenicida]
MKKALLIAAIAATASMPSLANDNYAALELGFGKYDTSGEYGNNEAINKDTGLLALKFGHYFNPNVRAYGYIQTNGESSTEYKVAGIKVAEFTIKSNEIGAGADYIHNVNEQFYLLAGGNLGVYKSEFEAKVPLLGFNEDSSNTGLTAGANLGIGYKFTERFGMELGYRYSHYFDNEHKIGAAKANFDSTSIGYLNASYSF